MRSGTTCRHITVTVLLCACWGARPEQPAVDLPQLAETLSDYRAQLGNYRMERKGDVRAIFEQRDPGTVHHVPREQRILVAGDRYRVRDYGGHVWFAHEGADAEILTFLEIIAFDGVRHVAYRPANDLMDSGTSFFPGGHPSDMWLQSSGRTVEDWLKDPDARLITSHDAIPQGMFVVEVPYGPSMPDRTYRFWFDLEEAPFPLRKEFLSIVSGEPEIVSYLEVLETARSESGLPYPARVEQKLFLNGSPGNRKLHTHRDWTVLSFEHSIEVEDDSFVIERPDRQRLELADPPR